MCTFPLTISGSSTNSDLIPWSFKRKEKKQQKTFFSIFLCFNSVYACGQLKIVGSQNVQNWEWIVYSDLADPAVNNDEHFTISNLGT